MRKATKSRSDSPQMKAAAIDRFGPPFVLKLHRFPMPQPGPGEVLIALHSAGVGVWDASVRDGSWRPFSRPKFPLILGTDGAGIVVSKGGRVRRLQVGDRVWACHYANPKGGFYAEYIAVDAEHVGAVPQHLDLLHAGAAVTTGLTAIQGIENALRLRFGDRVLVYGASGGVGTLAVQFAKHVGAHVIATASGRRAAAFVRSLGADDVFDARSRQAAEHLQTFAPEGIDAALVLASGESLEPCLNLIRRRGRIAYPNGVEPEPQQRNRIRVLAYDAVASPKEFARLARAASEARLCVPLAGIYSLPQAAKAHGRLERGHILGRIVLRIGRAATQA